MNVAAVLITAAVMALGVVGTVVPVLPGLGVVLLAGVGYGLVEGFGVLGWVAIGVMAALAAGGTAAKYALAGRSAAQTSTGVLVAGGVGAVIGFFAIPVLGFVVGGAAGVLLAQYERTSDWGDAWRRTHRVLVSFGIGALIEIASGLAMVAVWLVWVLVPT